MMDKNTGKRMQLGEHIRQSIFNILQTTKGSRILNRNFGSNVYELIDQPINIVATSLSSEIADSLSVFEKRVKVTEIDCSGDGTGKVVATITLDNNSTITGEL